MAAILQQEILQGITWTTLTSGPVSLPAPATIGSRIVVVVRRGDGTTSGQIDNIADTGTTAYSQAIRQTQSAVGTVLFQWSGIATSVDAGQDVTVELTGSEDGVAADDYIAVFEIGNPDLDQVFDASNTDGTETDAATNHSAGPLTPAGDGAVLIGTSSGTDPGYAIQSPFAVELDTDRSTIGSYEQTTAAAVTYTVTSPDPAYVGVALVAYESAADEGIDADMAVTEGADTFAAEVFDLREATLAVTEGSDTLSTDIDVIVAGTLAVTEGSDTLSTDIDVIVTGTLAVTEGADTLVADILDVREATLAVTEGADTISAPVNVLVAGTLAVTEEADTLAADVVHEAVAAEILQQVVEPGPFWATTTGTPVSLPGPATIGSRIVVLTRFGDGSGSSSIAGIVDDGDTEYTVAKRQPNGTIGLVIEQWSGIATSVDAGQNVVVTQSDTGESADDVIAIVEIANPDAAQVFNSGNTSAVDTDPSNTAHTSGNLTPASNGAVLIGFSSGGSGDYTIDAEFEEVLLNNRTTIGTLEQVVAAEISYDLVSDPARFASAMLVIYESAVPIGEREAELAVTEGADTFNASIGDIIAAELAVTEASDTVSVTAQSLSYIVILTSLATAGDRITAIPDLEVGWWLEVGPTVTGGTILDVQVYPDGTFDVDAAVTSFEVRAWDGSEWGAYGVQYTYETIEAALATTEAADSFAGIVFDLREATLAVTEGSDTVAADANVIVSANLATTEAADTLAAIVEVAVAAALAVTEGSDTIFVNAGSSVIGSLAVTEGADSISVSAEVVVTATMVVTEGADSAVLDADVIVAAALAATEAADTFIANAGAFTLAQLAVTEGDDTLAADVSVQTNAQLSVTEGADSVSAEIVIHVEASMAVTEGADTAFFSTLPLQSTTIIIRLRGGYVASIPLQGSTGSEG